MPGIEELYGRVKKPAEDEGQGLAEYVYGENPHDARRKDLQRFMPQGGIASIPMAFMAGRESSKGRAWDEKANTARAEYGQQQAQAKAADDIFSKVVEISKHDAPAATKILQEEAKRNPLLQKYQGVKFVDETTREGWTTIEDGTGQPYQLYLPALGMKGEDGQPLTNEQMEKQGFLRRIGKPKPPGGGSGNDGPLKMLNTISTMSKRLADGLGDPSIMEAIANAQSPEERSKLFQSMQELVQKKDPALQDIATSLEKAIKHYESVTGDTWKGDVPKKNEEGLSKEEAIKRLQQMYREGRLSPEGTERLRNLGKLPQ